MPTVDVDGARLWYEEHGRGEPIVQIHGGGLGHANFALATPQLARDFRVIDYDQRGYGQSDRPRQRYDFDVWADDVAALLDGLGLPRAHIHGTSLGGMVALAFAARHPARVERLVINCAVAKFDFAGRLHYEIAIDLIERLGVDNRTYAGFVALRALAPAYLDGPGGEAAIERIRAALAASTSPHVYLAACRAMIAMDLRPCLAQIRAPTLVIGGEHDRMTPWDTGPSGCGMREIAQRIRGARAHGIAGAGHTTLFDAVDEHCRVVRDFLHAGSREPSNRLS
jgi:pimeloyl-ACP methyl ester carboxylesterase